MKLLLILTILIFPSVTIALCHFRAPSCEKILVEEIINVSEKYPDSKKLNRKDSCILKFSFGDKKQFTREAWASLPDCSVIKKGFEGFAVYNIGCDDSVRWPPCKSQLCKYEDIVASISISPRYYNGDEQFRKSVPSECKHILKEPKT